MAASCPDCGKEVANAGALTFHRMAVHGYRPPGKDKKKKDPRTPDTPRETPAATDAKVEADVRKAVGYVQGLGGLLKMAAPHAGTAIMGVEVPEGQSRAGSLEEDGRHWYVRSRAVMAMPTLLEQAKRNAQIYAMVRAWIQFCESGVIIEAAGGVVAAAAVDAGVPAGFGFKVGPIPIQPIPMMIPDVLEWVAMEELQAGQEAAAGPGNGQAEPSTVDEAAVVQGGVTGT